jgi:uncharacterized membrane protein YbhN (UPF0104 family)
MTSAVRPQPAAAGAPAAKKRGITSRRWWPWAKRGFTFAFFALVAWLTVRQARTVDWDAVWTTLRGYPAATLLLGAGLAAASHALYSTFDLLGRRYTGHALPARTVMTVTFISYAFNLNFGSLVGGVAFRYRLYSRLGLGNGQITRVLSISMLTNWLGYLLLGGTVFAFWPLALPPDWKLDSGGLRVVGFAMLAVVCAYLALCVFKHGQRWSVRGHEFEPPTPRFALVQLALSALNWSIIGSVVYVLLQGSVSYPAVLSVLLVAAVAGVITHVPAGLGVLEAVFVTLLSHLVPTPKLLAALLAYRALYYLAPVMVATLLYLIVETRARRLRRLKKARPAGAH